MTDIALLPDAGPLITLAYADALDLLLKPGWSVEIVDMVLHKVTRNETPSAALSASGLQPGNCRYAPPSCSGISR